MSVSNNGAPSVPSAPVSRITNAIEGFSNHDKCDGLLYPRQSITHDINIMWEDEPVSAQANSAAEQAHPFSTSCDQDEHPVLLNASSLRSADKFATAPQSARAQAQQSEAESEEKKDGSVTSGARTSVTTHAQAIEELPPERDSWSKLKKVVNAFVGLGHAAPMGLAVASVVDEAHRLDAKLHVLGGGVLGVLAGLALFTAADRGSDARLHLLNAVQLGGLFVVNEFVPTPDPRVYTAVAAEAVLLLFALSIICRQPRA
jgi:hypothetical protein